MRESAFETLRNLKEKDPKKKPKWNDMKEYRRLRANYTNDVFSTKALDVTEIMERADRFDARQRNRKPQYI